MPHAAIDIGFITHPKIVGLSPLAQLLHIRTIVYGVQHLTDGFVPEAALPLLMLDFESGQAPLQELLGIKMLEPVTGGYHIHDFLDYQLSKAQVEGFRERSKKGGQATKAKYSQMAQPNGQAIAQANLPSPPLPSDSQGCSDSSHVEIVTPVSVLPAAPPKVNGSTNKPGKGKRPIADTDKPTPKHFRLGASLRVDVGPAWGKFKNYCLAHNKWYANYEAAFRNWIVETAERQQQRVMR